MESEDEEMDSLESDKIESSFSDSSSSGSEEESEIDEIESERWRNECVDNMSSLEFQFTQLKDHLFKEKSQQLAKRLELVRQEVAAEYLEPIAMFEDMLKIKLNIADVRVELRRKNLQNRFDAEKQASLQNFESDKINLHDFLYHELLDKIQRLKQDQQNTDMSAGIERLTARRKSNKILNAKDRRRKPVVVSGPYIVYMLPESQILEDYATIKLALKHRMEVIHSCQREVTCQDGRLHYQGDIFMTGDCISVSTRNGSAYSAKITSVDTKDVKLITEDGLPILISLSQLHQEKYILRPL